METEIDFVLTDEEKETVKKMLTLLKRIDEDNYYGFVEKFDYIVLEDVIALCEDLCGDIDDYTTFVDDDEEEE